MTTSQANYDNGESDYYDDGPYYADDEGADRCNCEDRLRRRNAAEAHLDWLLSAEAETTEGTQQP